MATEEKYAQPLWTSVVSGTVGGVCAVIIGHPFESVKVRLQTGRRQGLFGSLFAGVSAPLLAVTPQWALMYAAYFWSQSALDSSSLSAEWRGALSGMFCGVVVALVQAPVDAVKIKAQNEKLSSAAVLRRLATQKDCLRMVREGVLASSIHNGISQAIFFATYEHVLRRIKADDESGCRTGGKKNVGIAGVDWRPALAGGVSGVVEWTTCMATDNIKTRVQASAGHLRYFDALSLLYKEHGVRGFYRGYFPILLRAVPVNASSYFVIECVNVQLSRMQQVRKSRRLSDQPYSPAQEAGR